MLYLDSSAIVKLVVEEPETDALRKYLRRRPVRATSELAVTEVLRAALRRDSELLEAARRVLDRLDRIALGTQLVARAGSLRPPEMRTLDALHVAAAFELAEELEAFVAYDRRLLDAARFHQLPTASPA